MLNDDDRTNFETMQQASRNGHLALMECTDNTTGLPVAVVCMVNVDGDECVFVPVARMFDGNPYEQVTPPTP